tara:strand:- start:526 stop:780 length:255 start_codon:yes stop_codon:yes gene_type:complete
MTKKDSLKKKVLYRSKYRGTKEMDILLSRFVESCIDNLDEKDLLTLYEFLNYEDEVIYNFYIGNNDSNYESKNKFFKIFKNFKI